MSYTIDEGLGQKTVPIFDAGGNLGYDEVFGRPAGWCWPAVCRKCHKCSEKRRNNSMSEIMANFDALGRTKSSDARENIVR
mmetsp:Transcript_33807/g.62236  ORF Transcript_33807/g.62236 Transcript_33807/m.62236 type:complete len:81 (+) Transcript_33807:477-719(+)